MNKDLDAWWALKFIVKILVLCLGASLFFDLSPKKSTGLFLSILYGIVVFLDFESLRK